MSLEATLATWELTKIQVNSREKFLLLSLARRAGEDHTCWPSIKRIAEDTGFDRKTVVDVRQALIDKKLIKYTGRMVGRSNQIPEMELLYAKKWDQKRNSIDMPVDKYDLTSPVFGTGTSPVFGTGTSTENGTLNSTYENVSRKKSFYEKDQKKSKNEWKQENRKKHTFAESKNSMALEVKKIEEHAKIKRVRMPENLRFFVNGIKKGIFHE